MSWEISKSNVESYKLRNSREHVWADIAIDPNGEAGRIQIASDYGDWQYYWSHCGKPFKKFLQKLDKQYVARKFGAENYFDGEATISSFRREILDARRGQGLSAQEARLTYDQCATLQDCNSLESFYFELGQLDELMKFFDYCPHLHKTYTPGFSQFWDQMWPVFVAELAREEKEVIV